MYEKLRSMADKPSPQPRKRSAKQVELDRQAERNRAAFEMAQVKGRKRQGDPTYKGKHRKGKK